MRFPGFIGPSYVSQSVNVDCQRAVNLFPEINALGTGKEKEVASLVSTPGLTLLLTLPESPHRGLYTASNREVYAVGGNKLYSIDSNFLATQIGVLSSSDGPVSMADNGTQLVIVDGVSGYSWNMSTDTFEEITDEDFPTADLVTFQDGYFICTQVDSQQFSISGLNDVTFDGLDVASAEGVPDNLVGAIAFRQQLYLFGTQSLEVFYNSGDADFPFTRIQGAVVDVGGLAPFTIKKLADSIFWVGGDENGYGIVYQLQGFQPVRISTPSIEGIIRDVDPEDIEDATAWTYQKGGHEFYCLNLPGVDSTWVYDASTGMWHERRYLGHLGLGRHRAEAHTLAFGKNIVGDYENGNIYELDSDVYTDEVTDDDPTPIIRQRTAPHLTSGLKNIFHKSFQLDMEVGVGLDGDVQGSNPSVMLRWSDDGGHSWSNERTKSIGQIGQTKTRVKFNRLGVSRDRIYEVTFSDPVPITLIGAELDVEEGVA